MIVYTGLVRNKIVRLIALSQVSLFGFLAICCILMPKFLFARNEGGISNFGVHRLTIIPFTLAFALCGIYLLQAVRLVTVHSKSTRQFRFLLEIFIGILLSLLISTYVYKINSAYKNIHIAAGSALFYFELGGACWLALRLVPSQINRLLLGIVIIGFVLGAFTLIGWLHLLFIAQVITGVAFGLLLIHSSEMIVS